MLDCRSKYDQNAEQYIRQYESLRAADVHKNIIEYLPETQGWILDVGSGSGRDAAWMASKGYHVIAVEPSEKLRKYAETSHASPNIKWLDDSLPYLEATHRLGLTYDLILLSAVWMHVYEKHRKEAFRQLITLLNPGGYIVISLRLGPVDYARHMYVVSVGELDELGKSFGMNKVKEVHTEDQLGRKELSWAVVVYRLREE